MPAVITIAIPKPNTNKKHYTVTPRTMVLHGTTMYMQAMSY